MNAFVFILFTYIGFITRAVIRSFPALVLWILLVYLPTSWLVPMPVPFAVFCVSTCLAIMLISGIRDTFEKKTTMPFLIRSQEQYQKYLKEIQLPKSAVQARAVYSAIRGYIGLVLFVFLVLLATLHISHAEYVVDTVILFSACITLPLIPAVLYYQARLAATMRTNVTIGSAVTTEPSTPDSENNVH